MTKNSIIGIFREGSEGVIRDMNTIVGKSAVPAPGDPLLPPLTDLEYQQMQALLATEGRGLTQVQKNILDFLIRRHIANGGADPRIAPPPADGPSVPLASMLDLSSPMNTIVKSVFLLSTSAMFTGTIHFYFIWIGCAGAIIYSLTKNSIR